MRGIRVSLTQKEMETMYSEISDAKQKKQKGRHIGQFLDIFKNSASFKDLEVPGSIPEFGTSIKMNH